MTLVTGRMPYLARMCLSRIVFAGQHTRTTVTTGRAGGKPRCQIIPSVSVANRPMAWEDRPYSQGGSVLARRLLRIPGARVLLVAVSVAVAGPLLTGCGGLGQDDDPLPPLTPEPGLSLPQASSPPQASGPPSASRSGTRASYPARLALMQFLRGVGAGDRRVCGLLAPSYARTAFAADGGCAAWIGAAPTRLTPDELHGLRTVRVLGATPGPRPGQFTVRPADLRWSSGGGVPRDVVAQRYVLARVGGRWLVIA
jgi:hypothetical protein